MAGHGNFRNHNQAGNDALRRADTARELHGYVKHLMNMEQVHKLYPPNEALRIQAFEITILTLISEYENYIRSTGQIHHAIYDGENNGD